METSSVSKELHPIKSEQKIIGTTGYTLMILSMTITTSIFFLGWISQVLGLSLAQTIVAAFIGNAVVAIVMYLNGYVGVKEGIPFPIQLRTSFGTRGSILPMVVRMIVDAVFTSISLNYFTAVAPKVVEFNERVVSKSKITKLRDLANINIEEVTDVWKNKRSWVAAKEIASYISTISYDDREALRIWASNARLKLGRRSTWEN